MDKTHQLLQFLSQQPSTLTQLLTTLQVELTNINDIYISYRPIIIPAINLLNMDPSFDGHSNHNNCLKRSLLPFLGDALSWLMETATTAMACFRLLRGYDTEVICVYDTGVICVYDTEAVLLYFF